MQYDGDVTIIIDLGKRQEIRRLHALFFQGPRNFEVEDMTFHASEDGRKWKPLAVIENDQLDPPDVRGRYARHAQAVLAEGPFRHD